MAASRLDCVSLTGMPGAGKSTVGVLLAKHLGKDFVDTDLLIQHQSGKTLQAIVDSEGYLALLEIEQSILQQLQVDNCVIATGGSVVYSESSMNHLKRLGPVVYLKVPFATVEQRVDDEASRGLARKPGQGLEALYRERTPLYERYADFTVDAGVPPGEVVRAIAACLYLQR